VLEAEIRKQREKKDILLMTHIVLGYPSLEEETEILRRRVERRRDESALESVLDERTFLAMREAVEEVYVDPDLGRYIASISSKTRGFPKVAVGASPRGSLALLKLARSWAAMDGRAYALPDDVKSLFAPLARHRVMVTTTAEMEDVRAEQVLLVGHRPHLDALLAASTGADGEPFTVLKKAGAALVDWAPPGGELRWLLTPAMLRRLGGGK